MHISLSHSTPHTSHSNSSHLTLQLLTPHSNSSHLTPTPHTSHSNSSHLTLTPTNESKLVTIHSKPNTVHICTKRILQNTDQMVHAHS